MKMVQVSQSFWVNLEQVTIYRYPTSEASAQIYTTESDQPLKVQPEFVDQLEKELGIRE